VLDGSLELWLVRHGETVWNHEGRVQGWSDPLLSARGEAQAEKLAPRLEHTFSAVYSSGSQRATETARLALPGVRLEPDARLRELYFGAWEGRLWSEVADTDAEALNAWFADPYRNTPTGGETYAALAERVQAWRASLPETGRVLAFTHGGPLRAVLYGLTGLPDGHRWRFDVAPASLTKLVLGEHGVIIQTVGDVAHLEHR
jgi:broad specificity phosphatase PhoE